MSSSTKDVASYWFTMERNWRVASLAKRRSRILMRRKLVSPHGDHE